MNLLVFDLETTGLDSDEHGIVSVAAKLYNKDRQVVNSFNKNCFNEMAHINLQALLVNRFTISKLREFKSEKQVLEDFCDWLLSLPRDTEIVIGGHNCHFDIDFIKTKLKLYGIDGFDQVASYRVIDSASWGRLLAMSKIIPENSKISLSSLAQILNIPYDSKKHHTAEYDVELTAKVIFSIVDLLESKWNEQSK